MAVKNPSWDLSRYVRSTIVCRDLPVDATTANADVIGEVAGNLLRNGHEYIAGYDTETVRAILLDTTVTSPYPAEAPAKYAGK